MLLSVLSMVFPESLTTLPTLFRTPNLSLLSLKRGSCIRLKKPALIPTVSNLRRLTTTTHHLPPSCTSGLLILPAEGAVVALTEAMAAVVEDPTITATDIASLNMVGYTTHLPFTTRYNSGVPTLLSSNKHILHHSHGLRLLPTRRLNTRNSLPSGCDTLLAATACLATAPTGPTSSLLMDHRHTSKPLLQISHHGTLLAVLTNLPHSRTCSTR